MAKETDSISDSIDQNGSDGSQNRPHVPSDFNGGDFPHPLLSGGSLGRKRRTYYIRLDLDDKIRGYAYWERLAISEVVNLALEEFFADKEVKAIPEKSRQSR
jgi:hypothetical protein